MNIKDMLLDSDRLKRKQHTIPSYTRYAVNMSQHGKCLAGISIQHEGDLRWIFKAQKVIDVTSIL